MAKTLSFEAAALFPPISTCPPEEKGKRINPTFDGIREVVDESPKETYWVVPVNARGDTEDERVGARVSLVVPPVWRRMLPAAVVPVPEVIITPPPVEVVPVSF